MGAVFSSKNLVFWWVFLTSFIFLQGPTRNLATYFRNGGVFNENNFPFYLAKSMTDTIDAWAESVVKAFQFNPTTNIVSINGRPVLTGFTVGLLLAGLLLVLAVRFYMSAVRSPRIVDDFLAIFVCFVVYHLEAQTFTAINLKIGQAAIGPAMIETRSAWVGFLAIVIIGLIVSSRGFQNSQVFWKGIFELFVVWLFLVPRNAGQTFASLLDGLANIGQYLDFQKNATIVVIWALLGMVLGAHRLYNAQGATAGGGGGGGGGKPAGGGAKA